MIRRDFFKIIPISALGIVSWRKGLCQNNNKILSLRYANSIDCALKYVEDKDDAVLCRMLKVLEDGWSSALSGNESNPGALSDFSLDIHDRNIEKYLTSSNNLVMARKYEILNIANSQNIFLHFRDFGRLRFGICDIVGYFTNIKTQLTAQESNSIRKQMFSFWKDNKIDFDLNKSFPRVEIYSCEM